MIEFLLEEILFMSFWSNIKRWVQVDNVNGFANVKSQKQLVNHELIERSSKTLDAYQKWKSSRCKTEMLSYISQNFKVWKKTSCEQCEAIDFLKAKSFKGFVVHFMDLDKECNEVKFLFDYLKERVIALGYRPYVSDAQVFQKVRWKEKIERHYLKPLLETNEKGLQNQRFGNINIELLLRDSEPIHLKFSACFYHDRKFTPVEDFDTLIAEITQE